MSQLQHASTAEATGQFCSFLFLFTISPTLCTSERQGSGDRMVKGYSRSGKSRGKKRKNFGTFTFSIHVYMHNCTMCVNL